MQVTPGVPGVLPPVRQCRHTTGVDELQTGQVNDDLRVSCHGCDECGSDAHCVCHVELSAQYDDNAAVAFAGTQIHADHSERLPASAARRGLGPAASSLVPLSTLRRISVIVLSGQLLSAWCQTRSAASP